MFEKAKGLYEKGMTMEKVAQELGVNRTTISRWFKENGYKSRTMKACKYRGLPQYNRTRKAWQSMHSRCKKNTNYIDRNIYVCLRWNEFDNFIEDMGLCPPGLTLERIDNDQIYCKSNCKWATVEEQANNKRNNIFVTYNGRKKSITQWSREVGISAHVLRRRVLSGMSVFEILHKPVKPFNRKFIKYDGESKTVKEWSEELDIRENTIRVRLRRGWTIGEALELE